MEEKRIDTRTIYNGRIVNLRVDTVMLPNGRNTQREIVEHPGAVAIVPVLSNGNIVLVKQYRAAVGKVLLELPAGTLEKGEDPHECALRELEEETGLSAGKMKQLVTFYPSPGFCSETIHVFVASELTKTQSSPDPDEFLRVVKLEISEILDRINTGEIEDGKTLVGILCYLQRGGGI
ncbi:MAG: NUDIX hydrolase [Clostridia bacterium]|nr:NUDIX hydrolase [Clostridia bacterium]